MKSDKFSLEGKKMLYSIKSKCYPAKENVKKKFIREILTVHFNVAD